MDQAALQQALFCTYAGNKTQQQQAEKYLEHLEDISGYTPFLFQMCMAEQVDINLRKAAAIQVKNVSKKKWKPDEAVANTVKQLQDADKNYLRTNIVEGIIRASSSLRYEYAYTLHMLNHQLY